MRKQWKLSAQRLLALSAFGILTGFSSTGLINAAEQTKSGVIIASAKPTTENKAEDSIALAEAMRIHIEFLADPLISTTDISPSVKNGKMILNGNVNNNTVANNAVALASRLTTCKVISEIRIWPVSFNKTTKVPVETLQANTNKVVSAEFQSAYPKLSTAVSADGSIIVSGPVVTLEDKLEISKRLRKVPGCQRVVNKMTVQPMRMGKETVTMVNKDGTKWIVGKDKTTAPTEAIQLNPTTTTSKEITQAIVSTKPSDKIAPAIVPTQNIVQSPKTTNSKEQRPQVLPESLVPVTPVAKPLPTPDKKVDVFSTPKIPTDWDSKKSEQVQKKEPVKPAESTAKKVATEDKAKPVTKTVEAKTTSTTKEKTEVFPSFPNLNKKSEKPETTASTPVINKDVPVVKQDTPVAPIIKKDIPIVKQATPVTTKKELPKLADKKELAAPKVLVENETIKGKVDTVTKSAARTFIPAHDPIGSAPVKSDMLGFPSVKVDAPAPETKKPLVAEKIPARYATNSDKDGDYSRPYLATRTQAKPVTNEKMFAEKATNVASKPAAKLDKIAEVKQSTSVASQALVKKEPTPNTAKVIAKPEVQAATVSNNKSKTVPATTASKKVESSTKPNVATGSISFDSEEDASAPNANKQMALTALKKQIEQVCGKKAASIQVIEKPDGSRVLLIDVAQGSKQEDLAKTLFSMPEIAENNVSIEFIIK
ncbi:MAG: BON domain-containing protein [Planctomycetota bacterium]|nr:BON domain-containing protein [Planctomycetota bacterium]